VSARGHGRNPFRAAGKALRGRRKQEVCTGPSIRGMESVGKRKFLFPLLETGHSFTGLCTQRNGESGAGPGGRLSTVLLESSFRKEVYL